MLSPQVSVSTPEGANPPTTRRRGLSYLRNLSQNRLAGGSPTEPSRTSPRHLFQRSISYTEPRHQTSNSGRRRSASRPSERHSPPTQGPRLTRITTIDSAVESSEPTSPTPQPRRSRSLARPAESREEEAGIGDDMARNRPASVRRSTMSANGVSTAATNSDSNGSTARPRITRAVTPRVVSSGDTQDGEIKTQLPTLRFFPHQEQSRNGRQSLNFSPIARTLPNESAIIRVGRYSEREGIPLSNPTVPSDAPVGFKSKVVSRKHCEFSFVDGQWQIRDVASSSGTFLNHIRLSGPNTESRLFPIKDGDIVQLGIDFRGGEEMIFRCVKIRIECNRAWQKKPNTFK